MFFGWRPRSLRLWAVLGAWAVLACQFPDYDLGNAAPSGGSGATAQAGSTTHGGDPSLGGAGTGGAGAMTTGGVAGGAGNSASGSGSEPSAGTETGGHGGSAGSAGSVGAAGTTDAGAAGMPGDPKVLLDDDFQSGGADPWFEVAGTLWSVALDGSGGNSAYQLTPVFNGFYASAAKDGPWTDQVLEADVKVLAFGGTSSSDVVALFGRYGNLDNYYAAVLRPDGRVAIRLRLAGASPTTLKTSGIIGVAVNTWYRVRFELVGAALRLYVDEQLRVELQDGSLSKGTVALGGDNSAAAFDNVLVTLP